MENDLDESKWTIYYIRMRRKKNSGQVLYLMQRRIKEKLFQRGEETSNRLTVGEEVLFQNGNNFTHEGKEYVAVHRSNILAILG